MSSTGIVKVDPKQIGVSPKVVYPTVAQLAAAVALYFNGNKGEAITAVSTALATMIVGFLAKVGAVHEENVATFQTGLDSELRDQLASLDAKISSVVHPTITNVAPAAVPPVVPPENV